MSVKPLLLAMAVVLGAMGAEASNIAFFYKALPEATCLCSDSVQIDCEFVSPMACDFRCEPVLEIRVKNLSQQPLYVDLGKTFLAVNEVAKPFYASASDDDGGNLDRYMLVPPKMARVARAKLFTEDIPALHMRVTNAFRKKTFLPVFDVRPFAKHVCGKKQSVPYTREESPLSLSFYATLSFSEDFSDPTALKAAWYVDRIAHTWGGFEDFVGHQPKKGKKLLKTFPDWEQWGPFFLGYAAIMNYKQY